MLTIIPVAPSVTPPLWSASANTSFPPLPPVSLVGGSSFLRTSLAPPWQDVGGTARHPLWITHNSQFPEAIVDGELPLEVPSPYKGMSAEWAATVSQLVRAKLAEIKDGEAVLTDFLRIRAPGIRSRTLSHLNELEWILSVHRDNSRINSGVIEPVPYEELIGPTKALAALIAANNASEEDKSLHARMFRALIHRTEDYIAVLRGSDDPESS